MSSPSNIRMTSAVDLYKTFLNTNSQTTNFTSKNRLNYLNNHLKRSAEMKSNEKKPLNLLIEDEKTKKIQRLFNDIFTDEKEGIKSPIHGLFNKKMKKAPSIEKMERFGSEKKTSLKKFENSDFKSKTFRQPFSDQKPELEEYKFTSNFEEKNEFESSLEDQNIIKLVKLDNLRTKTEFEPKRNLRTKTEFEPKRYDSRFEEIKQLRHENDLLKKRIRELEREIKTVDEFKVALEEKKEPKDFNEKRVAMLKAQIGKQKKYIKNLLKSICLLKKFYRDSLGVLNLFQGLNSKYSDSILHADKLSKNIKTRNEVSILCEIDEKQKTDSMLEIVHSTKNTELLEMFMMNFNDAYEKVKDFERKNEELKKVFEITDEKVKNVYKDQIKKVRYTYLLQQFVQKYKLYFPIKTCFDLFEPREKDSLDSHLTKLIGLMNKIENIMQKVSSIELLQNNQFYQMPIPQFINDNSEVFRSFLNRSEGGLNIILDYETVSGTENSLASLLSELLGFEMAFITNKESISIESILNLKSHLRENIEKLVSLGIVLEENDETILINQVQNDYNIGSKEDFKTLIYRKDEDCNTDFQKVLTFLTEGINEIEPLLNENMKLKIKNMRIHILSLRRLWEQKKTSNFLKDLDFSFTQRELEILQKSVSNLENYVLNKTRHYSSFLQHLQGKLSSLLTLLPSASNLISSSSVSVNDLKERFQEKSKLVLKSILREIEEIGRMENDSQIGMKSLEEEFKIKVKILQDKWSFFNKRVSGELEGLGGK